MMPKVPALYKMDEIFNYLYHKTAAKQSDIARDLNLPKSTCNRLLKVLVHLNYLTTNRNEYCLGDKFSYYSSKYEKYTLLKNICYPYMEDLSLKYKETFKLSILENNKIRSIASVESTDFLKITVSENAIFPLHAGAASLLLICQLSDNKLNLILPKKLVKYTNTTITDIQKLKEELFKINIKKAAYDNATHSKNIKAIAFPILNKRNRIIAAISCPTFADEKAFERLEIIKDDLKKICNEISKRYNYFQ